MPPTDWSIQEIARLAGTTSRTLRYYDDIGLLPPSRIAANGYRHYDADALVRLQRVLMLRDLGLGLPAIAEALAGEESGQAATDQADALGRHLDWLRSERERLARQIASVERTITILREGGELMAGDMLDGFDHTRYEQEVTRRWGQDTYARSDAWWRAMSDEDRTTWKERTRTLVDAWTEAAASDLAPTSGAAQELARRHVEWLAGVPGTPGAGATPGKEYVVGLADMYVADPRFARNYGGVEGAGFVRDALRAYAEEHLA